MLALLVLLREGAAASLTWPRWIMEVILQNEPKVADDRIIKELHLKGTYVNLYSFSWPQSLFLLMLNL